jgi:two-component system chemotaxis sensor kinase CheA
MAARRRRTRAPSGHREFLAEAEEILERLRGGLADLAEAGGRNDGEPELVNRLFRDAHSLKGLSGMFGHDALGALAHRLEDALDDLRMGRRAGPAALPLLEETVSLFGAALAELGRGGSLEDAARGASELARRLEAAGEVAAPEPASLEALRVDPACLRALTEYEEHRLRESLARGLPILLVEAGFELAAFEEGLHELTAAIREVGEVISTLPSPGKAAPSRIEFSLLVAAELGAEELASRLELPPGSVRQVGGGGGGGPPERGAARRGPAPPAGATDPARPAAAEPDSLRSLAETVRVDVRKLEELLNLAGELVMQRAALGALAERLAREPATRAAGVELARIHKGLERRLQELQAAVLEVRMVPLRQVFEKLSRVARRLRLDLGKEVRLEIRGADTELDKLIVEQLVDPLAHLVRNAFDHAIEAPEARRAAGKPAEGCVRLTASQRGRHVRIEVADDGRGIDAERLRACAVARGLLPADRVLDRAECLELAFLPGLSTRDSASEISGRGVGLDVVRANVVALGGVVELDSAPGRGTRVGLTLPITLAIIQALLVRAAERIFAVPLNAILETLALAPGDLQRSERRELLHLRGEALPVLRLAEVFGLDARPAEKLFAVVVGLGETRAALLVDELLGQQDTVIKPIQGPVAALRGIAGATELGERGAVLVLDVAALVDELGARPEGR